MPKKKKIIQNTWVGGQSEGSRIGYDGSFQAGIGLDYYSDPDKLDGLPKLVKDSGTTVTDFVLCHAEDGSNDWFYGDTGKIYKRTSGGTWSNPKTVSNSTGNGMARFRTFDDYIWYAYDEGIGRIEDPTGTPIFNDNPLNIPTNEVLSFNSTVGANSYTTPTSISETAANKISFTAGDYPITGLLLRSTNAGTGDWSFILHDSSDNQIARIKVPNGDIPVGSLTFFSVGAVDVVSGDTYHWHVISTVNDGIVEVNTANNLSTARHSILQYQDGDIVDQSNIIAAADVTQRYQFSTTLSSVLSEDERVTFTPTKNLLRGIAPLFRAVAGGVDVTCTVHDSNNNVVATKTISGLSATVYSGYYEFEFDDPVYLQPGAEYHYHLYDSAGSTTVLVDTTGTYSTMFFKTVTPVLADAQYHTCKEFSNLLLVGNGNFLATIDDSEVYDTERLQFPRNEAVRDIEVIGDLALISTWQNNDISSVDNGYVYLWDGVSPTYIQFIKSSGQINAMANDGGTDLRVIAGDDGQIRYYNGALPLMRRIKDIERNATIEVYPNAISTWQGYTVFGISDGTSTEVQRVVYIYGRKDNDYPISLNPAFPVSTGVTDSNIQVGLVKGVSEDKLFVSWKDTSSGTVYGVDNIDNTEDQASVYFRTLRPKDDIEMEKEFDSVSVRCEPLTATQSIEVKYRKNNTGSFTNLPPEAGETEFNTLNGIYQSFVIPTDDRRAFEMEFEVYLKDSAGDTPTLLSFATTYYVLDDDRIGEK